jgi:hypothetical protein
VRTYPFSSGNAHAPRQPAAVDRHLLIGAVQSPGKPNGRVRRATPWISAVRHAESSPHKIPPPARFPTQIYNNNPQPPAIQHAACRVENIRQINVFNNFLKIAGARTVVFFSKRVKISAKKVRIQSVI